MQQKDTQRLFASLHVSATAKTQLAKIQKTLATLNKTHNIRWQSQPHMHITVRFLGNVPTDQTPLITQSLDQVAQSISSFELGLDRLESIPPDDSMRILWVRPKDDSATLPILIQRSELALNNFGDHEPRDAPIPHITIGRRRRTGSSINLPASPIPSCVWKITSLDLTRSVTEDGTLEHVVIHRARFDTELNEIRRNLPRMIQ